MVVLACVEEYRVQAECWSVDRDLEAQHIVIARRCALEVRHVQVHVSDAHVGVNCRGHGLSPIVLMSVISCRTAWPARSSGTARLRAAPRLSSARGCARA